MIPRIPVMDVSPVVEGGAYPAKAVVGEPFPVRATVFREGHDQLACEVVLTGPDGTDRLLRRMQPVPGDQPDRWEAWVEADAMGEWTFRVESWGDPYATWSHDAPVKIAADVDTELMLIEGGLLIERAAKTLPARSAGRKVLTAAVTALRDTRQPVEERLAAGLSPAVADVFDRQPLRELVDASVPHPLLVERPRALTGAWYEFFPRSEGAVLNRDGTVTPGTLRTAAERLPAVADMGFDVIYLPPIHPIGRINRKGRNNTLTPTPDDPGSPWAIGAAEGGHDAIHPELGDFTDFEAFVARAGELGLEVALDLALQCTPDHPWVREHPDWFSTRADGSIAYAENPPKKYQDIYPLNFDTDPDGIHAEVLRIVRLWMSYGVRIFRVDNPHTKPVQFWERLFAEIRQSDPDVVFLSEAFTRPAMMRALATVGFTQSYTYFTWRNTRDELESYLTEVSRQTAHVLRPNFFVNTPDILPFYLQTGNPAAFKVRAVLAATGSPSWGVYAGYELYEHHANRPGAEEYLDSEKYEIKVRDWDGAAAEGRTLAPYLSKLNEIRRAHPALAELRNLRLHAADNRDILCFSKRTGGPGTDRPADTVLVVVNLDPFATREATVSLDLPELGLAWDDVFDVYDEISGQSWSWGRHNYVRLDPGYEPAHVFTVRTDRA
jgi:starch synthase (maltosyl-transferring)